MGSIILIAEFLRIGDLCRISEADLRVFVRKIVSIADNPVMDDKIVVAQRFMIDEYRVRLAELVVGRRRCSMMSDDHWAGVHLKVKHEFYGFSSTVYDDILFRIDPYDPESFVAPRMLIFVCLYHEVIDRWGGDFFLFFFWGHGVESSYYPAHISSVILG